jgi:uncharacterized protein (TIGR03437 family)
MSFKVIAPALLVCATLQAQQFAVVNNASFRGDQPVSPGSWVAAFGSFSGVPATTATAFPLPKSLGGVRVSVDGVEAPLYDVRATQITFLIPGAVQPGSRRVEIATGSATLSGSIRVLAAGPGLFIKDTQTPPRGAARNQDGVTENSSSAPARRGDVISIYGTGQGELSRSVPDGAAPGATPSPATSKSAPQVYIGGVLAQVQFSGLNPDAPGLWQINAVIPNLPFISGRVPVRAFVDGVDSNEVTIFVAQ